jgi:hypothetical protein
MNIYYVYAYLREKDLTPYYIGKGSKNRAFEKHNVKVPKDPFRIIFLQQNLLEHDAFRLEIAYIKLFGRKDLGLGILRNITNGGEGIAGYKHTNETKVKIGKSSIGRDGPWKGRNHSLETKLKMSLSQTARVRSEDVNNNISKAKKGITVNLGKTYKTRVDKGSTRSSMKGKPWSEARILAQLNRRLLSEI